MDIQILVLLCSTNPYTALKIRNKMDLDTFCRKRILVQNYFRTRSLKNQHLKFCSVWFIYKNVITVNNKNTLRFPRTYAKVCSYFLNCLI
jgi:hypothetical protein